MIISLFPSSSEGHDGLAHSLADRNRLSDAISAAEDAVQSFPSDWRLRTTLAQVLNWSGRHVRAERTLQKLPEPYLESEDGLLHQTLAARWSNQPQKAFELASRFRDKHSDNPESKSLFRTLGYSYRGSAETVEVALSPSQRLQVGHGFRRCQDLSFDESAMTLNRYRAGWSGALGRRVHAEAGAADVTYNGIGRRVAADASISALLTDRVSVAAGASLAPTETLPALQRRLTAGQVWSDIVLRPTVKLAVSGHYSRKTFGAESTRQTAQASARWSVSKKAGQQIQIGVRSEWLWHDRPTPLLWSPSSFHTHLATVRMEGRLPGALDYIAEAGAGLQSESGQDTSQPIVLNFQLAKRIKPYLWLRADSGLSKASIGRLTPGRAPYQSRYLSIGLDYRFGGPG